jgi:hypothetical protein
MRPTVLLTRTYDFGAGPRLENPLTRGEIRRADAQCEPSYGHTCCTKVTVIGSPDAATGLAPDLEVPDRTVAAVRLDGVDYREPSAAAEFAGVITHGASLAPAPWRVTVHETANDRHGGCAREAV